MTPFFGRTVVIIHPDVPTLPAPWASQPLASIPSVAFARGAPFGPLSRHLSRFTPRLYDYAAHLYISQSLSY